MNDLRVSVFRGTDAALADHVDALAGLRIAVFRDFPYLYDGTVEYERKYLATYLECADSVIVLVFDGDVVVGASTGLPMAAETAHWQAPFNEQGYDISKVFYCGESVLLPAYRGRGLYGRFFRAREDHAKSLGGFAQIGFCAVHRPSDHPERPQGYRPLDRIWQRFGYTCHPELVAQYRWTDVGQTEETAKPLVFWLKPLPATTPGDNA